MALLKTKDIKNMNKEDREKKLRELELELIKSKVGVSKTGSSKIKEIKKIVARILTFNNSLIKRKLKNK